MDSILSAFRFLLQGFATCLQAENLSYLIPAVLAGLLTGLLPGISGMTALVILIPILYALGFSASIACIIIIGLSFVTFNAGAITSILFSVPGTDCSVATILDGYPLSKKGKSGVAIGAALCSSLLGAIIGCLLTLVLVWIIRPVILLFTPSEFFAVVVAGLLMICYLIDKDNVPKGVAAGALGLLVSFIGYDPIAGMPRFNFGTTYLYDGLTVIIITTGLFALPEFLGQLVKEKNGGTKETASLVGQNYFADLLQGFKVTFHHWGLVIRSALLGAYIGIVPGVGATVSTFLAYGMAKKTSKDPSRFGQGAIEGVIASETANNATQGGALLPLFGFGIPGNTVGALMLGALVMYGLTPGRELLTQHMDLVFVLIATGVLANILATIVLIPVSKYVTALSRMRVTLLYPPVLVLLCFAAYVMRNNVIDIFVASASSVMGILMDAYGYPRSVFLIAYVLGPILESNLFLAIQTRGPFFFLQRWPTMVILSVVILTYVAPVISYVTRRHQPRGVPCENESKVEG